MGVCREVFVFIQQKLAEKTYPGRIPIVPAEYTYIWRGIMIFSVV